MTSKREISAGTEAAATFESIDADFLRWKNRVPIGAYKDGGHWTCFRKVESFPDMRGELDDEAATIYEGIRG